MAFNDITPTKLGQAAITTGVTTLYTVPASTRAIVKNLDIVNTSAGALTYRVFLVPSAGTAGTANALFYDFPIDPKENIQWTGTQILNAGDTIQIQASGTGITITASGAEAV
jgi:hypothetical protein